MKTTLVVTAFIRRQGQVLLLKRSDQVGSYRGCWAAVSGHIEQVSALQQALIEIREETGLRAEQLRLVARGAMLNVVDNEMQRCWQVQPFLFELVDEGAEVCLDWEHDCYQWLAEERLDQCPTVPQLAKAYRSCLAGIDQHDG